MLHLLMNIVVWIIQGLLLFAGAAIIYGIYVQYFKKPDTARIEREDKLLAWADSAGIENYLHFKSDITTGHRIWCGIPRDKDKLHALAELDLSGCTDPRERTTPPLTSLPAEIGYLDNLVALNVSTNALEHLPEEIGELKHLMELNLFDNQLKDLPESLFALKKLMVLILSGNALESLPPQIANLQKLQVLHLNDNHFERLPEEINRLKKLTFLDIRGNPNLELSEQQIAWLVGGITLRCDAEQAERFHLRFEPQA
jgi:hypothetical protein